MANYARNHVCFLFSARVHYLAEVRRRRGRRVYKLRAARVNELIRRRFKMAPLVCKIHHLRNGFVTMDKNLDKTTEDDGLCCFYLHSNQLAADDQPILLLSSDMKVDLGPAAQGL